MNILICSSEVVPFAKTGGLADVAGSLPKELARLGHQVRVALPCYREVSQPRRPVLEMEVPLGRQGHHLEIALSEAVPEFGAYLVVSDPHFDREKLYGYPDDLERFILYQRAVMEMLCRLDWRPDVIHCNDWQTGLIPAYLKTLYRDRLPEIGSLFTVHNLAYQGIFPPEAIELAGLGRELFNMDQLEFYGQVNSLKSGLVFADLVSTVSPTYAQEIQTPEYGEKLDGVLRRRRGQLFGVLNGIDCQEWSPAGDPLIPARFQPGHLAGKRECKRALQDQVGLPLEPDRPLAGIVSRLAAQKGFDLLEQAMGRMLSLGLQMVALGVGEPHYHQLFTGLARSHPDQVAVKLAFDNELAHRIYAGSDLFLMPSRYEPCGLGQMISMRYGAIPVARATGGLADTVIEFQPALGEGTGFLFKEYRAQDLLEAVGRAVQCYRQPESWEALVANAMAQDFSWLRSARCYVDLHQQVRALCQPVQA